MYIFLAETFPNEHPGPSLPPSDKISARKYRFPKYKISFCQMSRNDKIQDIVWSDNFSPFYICWGIKFIHHQDQNRQ